MTESIEVKWGMRQSPWAVHTCVFNTINATNIIIAPGYHSDDRCQELTPEGKLILDTGKVVKDQGTRFVNDVNIGDYAIILESGNKTHALLVKITSHTYKKTIPEITVYKRTGYKNNWGGEECEVCLTGKNTKSYTHSNCMTAFVRDIEIVRKITESEIIFKKYWKLQASITQLKGIERWITKRRINEIPPQPIAIVNISTNIFKEAIDHCRWKNILHSFLENEINIHEFNNKSFEEILLQIHVKCDKIKGLGMLTIYDITSAICRNYNINIDYVYIIGKGPKRAIQILGIKPKTHKIQNLVLKYVKIEDIHKAFAEKNHIIDSCIKDSKNGDDFESYICNWQKSK